MKIVLIIILLLFTVISFAETKEQAMKLKENEDNCSCLYNSFNGRIEIISVDKTTSSIMQKDGAGFEGYDIRFNFRSQ